MGVSSRGDTTHRPVRIYKVWFDRRTSDFMARLSRLQPSSHAEAMIGDSARVGLAKPILLDSHFVRLERRAPQLVLPAPIPGSYEVNLIISIRLSLGGHSYHASAVTLILVSGNPPTPPWVGHMCRLEVRKMEVEIRTPHLG